MIRLYLVRHGETTYNAEHRVQGHEDPPLTELGVRQAEAVAERLAAERVDAIYSSDLIRASKTAEIIAARHTVSVRTTPLLREAHLGIIQGLTRNEIDRRFPRALHDWRNCPTARPPGAETVQQLIDRCQTFFDEVVREQGKDLTAVIVGHSGSLRGITICSLELPSNTYHKLRFSNASVSLVEIGDRNELCLLNDTCHLDTLLRAYEDADFLQ